MKLYNALALSTFLMLSAYATKAFDDKSFHVTSTSRLLDGSVDIAPFVRFTGNIPWQWAHSMTKQGCTARGDSGQNKVYFSGSCTGMASLTGIPDNNNGRVKKFGHQVYMSNDALKLLVSQLDYYGGPHYGLVVVYARKDLSSEFVKINQIPCPTRCHHFGNTIQLVDNDEAIIATDTNGDAWKGSIYWSTVSYGETESPTSSHVPSTLPTPAPSVTITPSFAPSMYPTNIQPKITDPLLNIVFDDGNTDNEIVLYYNITSYDPVASVLQQGCDTSEVINNTLISMTDETYDDNTKFKVLIDLKPEGIELDKEKNTVYNNTDPEEMTVNFCVRVDLIMSIDGTNESVTFQQTEVEVIVNTTQGFEVKDITLKTETTEKSENTTLAGDIVAKKCNRAGNDDDNAVKQSESVFICIENKAEASISDVSSLVFWKDSSEKLTAIKNRTPNAVTSKRALSDKKHIIQSRLVSRFYSNEGEVKVTATGAVMLGFGGSIGRRLQSNSPEGGDAAAAGGESGFDVNFKLAPLENDYEFDEDENLSAGSVMSGSMMGFFTLVSVFIMVMELI